MIRRIIISTLLTCACMHLRAQVSVITTIAGTDSAGYSGDGGLATNAKLNTPEFICLDKQGNVILADGFNNRIRKVTVKSDTIITIAGNGTPSYNGDNISATTAEIFAPGAVAIDTTGNIYFADAGNNRIRKINAGTGIITTVAGIGPSGVGVGGSAGDGGLATDAQLDVPAGVCVDKFGNIYIADYSNNKVRRVDAATGIITTFAGQQGPPMFTGWYVGYSGDGGPATNAVFSAPIQVFADSVGNVYVCDQWNHAIRKVDIATNIITTIAGNGTAGHSGDGGLAIHAQLNQPGGMDMDRQGNIYIAEYGSGVIRKIDAQTGVISTVAGVDTLGFSGDGGPATNAKLRCSDVHVDKNGTIYIADIDNNRIRKVFNPRLAVPNETPQAGMVSLYPNPAGNKLSVIYDFTDKEDAVLQITDLTGHVVVTGSLNAVKQKEVFDISNLPAGLYVYKVVQNSIVVSSGKIIKE